MTGLGDRKKTKKLDTCFEAFYWKFHQMTSPLYAILQDNNRLY